MPGPFGVESQLAAGGDVPLGAARDCLDVDRGGGLLRGEDDGPRAPEGQDVLAGRRHGHDDRALREDVAAVKFRLGDRQADWPAGAQFAAGQSEVAAEQVQAGAHGGGDEGAVVLGFQGSPQLVAGEGRGVQDLSQGAAGGEVDIVAEHGSGAGLLVGDDPVDALDDEPVLGDAEPFLGGHGVPLARRVRVVFATVSTTA